MIQKHINNLQMETINFDNEIFADIKIPAGNKDILQIQRDLCLINKALNFAELNVNNIEIIKANITYIIAKLGIF